MEKIIKEHKINKMINIEPIIDLKNTNFLEELYKLPKRIQMTPDLSVPLTGNAEDLYGIPTTLSYGQAGQVNKESLLAFVIDSLKQKVGEKDLQIAHLEEALKDARDAINDRDRRLSLVADAESIVRKALAGEREACDEAGRQSFRADAAERRVGLLQADLDSAREKLKHGDPKILKAQRDAAQTDNTNLRAENIRLRDENARLKSSRPSPFSTPPTGSSQNYVDLGLDPRILQGRSKDDAIRIVESMRRLHAQFVHPDRGGTTEAMTRINKAADSLKAWCERNIR